jgi:Tol biopolymer transport system component
MRGRSVTWRRRRRALCLIVVGLAAVAPASAQASWPGLNGWLSFNSNRFGTAASGDIFVMPSFGLPQVRLTEARPDDGQSAWSPDGRRIAFKSRRDGNNELYVMNADGSDDTRLTSSARVSEGQPAWSPDGRRLLYRKTPDNPIVQNADIWQIDVDPARPNARPVLERTGDERYPSYSPDGSKIVFRSDADLVDHSGDEELYVMNADGTDVRRLTTDPAHDEGPIWSPDGTKIAFASERGGSEDIWVMEPDGSDPRRLTDDPARDESPDWQPIPFATAGHVACGDPGRARLGAASVVAAGVPCRAALRLASRWAARAADGDRRARLQGYRCVSTRHTFDDVRVRCRRGRARDVALVWRDPGADLPGA